MLLPSYRPAIFPLLIVITLLTGIPQYTHVAASDIIVSNNYQCTDIGKNLIKKRASAEQIYVAVSLCEGIVHPMDSGLGGGFQAILYDYANENKVVKYLMSREYSPFSKALTKQPLIFGNAVGVPSVLAGYARLLGVTDCLVTSPKAKTAANHTRLRHYSSHCVARIKSGASAGILHQKTASSSHGVTYRDIFTDCIRLARHGFHVSPTFDAMYSFLPDLHRLITYNRITGMAMNPVLANFLDYLSHDPLRLLDPYVEWKNRRVAANHNIRAMMLSDLRYYNSKLTNQDFLAYKAQLNPVLSISFRYHNVSYKLMTMPSPAGGETIAFFAKMIEKINAMTRHRAITSVLNNEQIAILFVLCSRFAYAIKPYFRQLKASTRHNLIVSQAPRIARKLYLEVSRAKNDSQLIHLANRAKYRIPSTFNCIRLPQIRVKKWHSRSELNALFGSDNNTESDNDQAEAFTDISIEEEEDEDDRDIVDLIDDDEEEEENANSDNVVSTTLYPPLEEYEDEEAFSHFVDTVSSLNASEFYIHHDNDDNAESANDNEDFEGGVDDNPYGTTNVVVKRGKRTIIATSSINHSYGSGIMSTKLGIFYNNVLRDFTPSTWYQRSWDRHGNKRIHLFPNRVKTHSVPQSSMGCTLLVNPATNNPVFGIGGAGGFKITGAIFNVLWNYFVQGYSLNRSVNRLRLITKINYKRNLTELWYELPPAVGEIKNTSKNRPTFSSLRLNFSDSDRPHAIDFFYRHSDELNVKFIKEAGYSAVTAFTTLRNTTIGTYDNRRGGKEYVKR